MTSLRRVLSVFLLACLPSTITALRHSSSRNPLIFADTNRDGVVNELDAAEKKIWRTRRGAIFLPNIGDSVGRCPDTDLAGVPLSNDELWRCHDASGDHLLPESVQYAAPLLTAPMKGLSDDAVGHIYTEPAHTRDRVRIFWDMPVSADTVWAPVDHQLTFNSTSLRNGITLALDGRGLVTDARIWDGSVKVVFEVTNGNHTARDYVALKQAPVLLHHHLQPAKVVLSTAAWGDQTTESARQAHFLDSLKDAVADSAPIVLFNQSTDIWAQDFFEPGYASMPGPGGKPISIRILLRSAQSTREAGRQVFSQLRGPGIGGFQPGSGSGFGFEEINSGGNFETIPPYTSRSGRRWPHGRVITGTHYGNPPASSMLTFLRAQQSQTPFLLETGWLAIGHVDELIQFLPTPPSRTNPLNFTLAIADTTSALSLLRTLHTSGHGTTPFLSYNGSTTPDPTTIFLDPRLLLPNTTISSLLNNPSFLETNAYAQRHIDAALALLLAELPLREQDILRVPTLFKDVTYPWPITPDGLPSRLHHPPKGGRLLKSLMPQAINGLVLPGGHDGKKGRYVAPRQWGPVVEGMGDVFGEEVRRVYGGVGMEVVWVDDFMSHHVSGGEVHCGTNVLRGVEGGWWEV